MMKSGNPVVVTFRMVLLPKSTSQSFGQWWIITYGKRSETLCINDCLMYKNIITSISWGDEAKSLFYIKPLAVPSQNFRSFIRKCTELWNEGNSNWSGRLKLCDAYCARKGSRSKGKHYQYLWGWEDLFLFLLYSIKWIQRLPVMLQFSESIGLFCTTFTHPSSFFIGHQIIHDAAHFPFRFVWLAGHPNCSRSVC